MLGGGGGGGELGGGSTGGGGGGGGAVSNARTLLGLVQCGNCPVQATCQFCVCQCIGGR
jgi:hypothetical protein